jgi:hypothetical protein
MNLKDQNIKIFFLAILVIIESLILLYLVKNLFHTNPFKPTGKIVYFNPYENYKWELPTYSTHFMKYSENPILIYELVPNFSQPFDGTSIKLNRITTIKINSDGLRDVEHFINKPKDVIRIAIVGDSHEFGVGVELEETYSKVLEKMLNEECPKKYETIILAVPGYNIWQKIEFLKIKGIKYSPDIIIIGIGIDDLMNSSKLLELHEIERRKIRGINLTEEEYKREEYKRIGQVNANEINKLLSLNKREIKKMYESAFDTLDNLTATANISSKIILFERIHNYDEQIEALKEISKEKGWYFITSKESCANETAYDSNKMENRLHLLDVHPSVVGHKKLATLLFCNLKKLLLVC